jgi:hypothetical protein
VTRLVTGGRADLAVGGAPRAVLGSRESMRPPRLRVATPTPIFRPGPVVPPAPGQPSPEPAKPEPATLTITQEVVPPGPVTFSYGGAREFTLTGSSETRLTVPAGRHTISQREHIGWPLAELTCTGDTRTDRMTRTAEVDAGAGESVECRYRNERHDPVIAAAGDIACQSGTSCRHPQTSDLLVDRPELTRVLPLGDLQYESGLYSEFMAPGAYHDTWGRVRPITAPIPGNHEYETEGASGYFDYFNGIGQTAGPAGDRSTGYYSYDLGDWHLVALNSNLPTAAGSAQEQWLRADLAAHPASCTLAYWHHPRWTSGAEHGPAPRIGPLWRALFDAGADVVLSAHNHHYERFAPQDPAGAADWAGGMRQFVVGTGGAGLYDFATPEPNSEERVRAHGVLELTLHKGSYDWRFKAPAGAPLDAGSSRCHRAGHRYARRGMFSREADGSFSRIASLGFNLIDSVPGAVADLSPGLEAMVWVGNYDDASCSFEISDAELRADVEAHAGNPKVGVWFISDEPSPADCPDAYAQHAARTALIKSIDPTAEVLIVIDGNSAEATLDQIPHWKGIADHIGINPYVCWQEQPCHYEWIDRVAEEADAAGLDYWGVIQAFGEPDGEGFTMCSTTSGCGKPRLPTPAELHEQFAHWRATRMSGYLVFEWRWPDRAPALWLANQPELQATLASENARWR